MQNATKDSILAAADQRVIAPVKCAALGGVVYVREMLCEERDEWEDGWAKWRERRNGDPNDTRFFAPYLLSHVICDEAGNRIFDDTSVKQLGRIGYGKLRPIVSKALEINGMGQQAEEEEIKNSDAGQSEGSGTCSPESGAAP